MDDRTRALPELRPRQHVEAGDQQPDEEHNPELVFVEHLAQLLTDRHAGQSRHHGAARHGQRSGVDHGQARHEREHRNRGYDKADAERLHEPAGVEQLGTAFDADWRRNR